MQMTTLLLLQYNFGQIPQFSQQSSVRLICLVPTPLVFNFCAAADLFYYVLVFTSTFDPNAVFLFSLEIF